MTESYRYNVRYCWMVMRTERRTNRHFDDFKFVRGRWHLFIFLITVNNFVLLLWVWYIHQSMQSNIVDITGTEWMQPLIWCHAWEALTNLLKGQVARRLLVSRLLWGRGLIAWHWPNIRISLLPTDPCRSTVWRWWRSSPPNCFMLNLSLTLFLTLTLTLSLTLTQSLTLSLTRRWWSWPEGWLRLTEHKTFGWWTSPPEPTVLRLNYHRNLNAVNDWRVAMAIWPHRSCFGPSIVSQILLSWMKR